MKSKALAFEIILFVKPTRSPECYLSFSPKHFLLASSSSSMAFQKIGSSKTAKRKLQSSWDLWLRRTSYVWFPPRSLCHFTYLVLCLVGVVGLPKLPTIILIRVIFLRPHCGHLLPILTIASLAERDKIFGQVWQVWTQIVGDENTNRKRIRLFPV